MINKRYIIGVMMALVLAIILGFMLGTQYSPKATFNCDTNEVVAQKAVVTSAKEKEDFADHNREAFKSMLSQCSMPEARDNEATAVARISRAIPTADRISAANSADGRDLGLIGPVLFDEEAETQPEAVDEVAIGYVQTRSALYVDISGSLEDRTLVNKVIQEYLEQGYDFIATFDEKVYSNTDEELLYKSSHLDTDLYGVINHANCGDYDKVAVITDGVHTVRSTNLVQGIEGMDLEIRLFATDDFSEDIVRERFLEPVEASMASRCSLTAIWPDGTEEKIREDYVPLSVNMPITKDMLFERFLIWLANLAESIGKYLSDPRNAIVVAALIMVIGLYVIARAVLRYLRERDYANRCYMREHDSYMRKRDESMINYQRTRDTRFILLVRTWINSQKK